MQPINATIIEKDGKIGVKVDNQEYFDSYLRKVGIGERCSIQIDKPVMPGTDEQNRFMHALLEAFFHTRLHNMPEFFRNNLHGFKVYYKEQFAMSRRGVPESWAKYSKKLRMEFIEFLLSDIEQSGAFAESKKLQEIVLGAESAGYYGLKE